METRVIFHRRISMGNVNTKPKPSTSNAMLAPSTFTPRHVIVPRPRRGEIHTMSFSEIVHPGIPYHRKRGAKKLSFPNVKGGRGTFTIPNKSNTTNELTTLNTNFLGHRTTMVIPFHDFGTGKRLVTCPTRFFPSNFRFFHHERFVRNNATYKRRGGRTPRIQFRFLRRLRGIIGFTRHAPNSNNISLRIRTNFLHRFHDPRDPFVYIKGTTRDIVNALVHTIRTRQRTLSSDFFRHARVHIRRPNNDDQTRYRVRPLTKDHASRFRGVQPRSQITTYRRRRKEPRFHRLIGRTRYLLVDRFVQIKA